MTQESCGMSRLSTARAAALAILACLAALTAASTASAAPTTLRVGTQTLRRCERSPLAYCGSLAVPLDHSAPSSPDISISYRLYPASAAGAATGTVLPVEGGPGYPSTGSSPFYGEMYGPLLAHWNMLTVDNRGTGSSSPINCPGLQSFSGATATEAFRQAAGECGASLNSRWHYPGGAPVHASDLFTSAAAAQDLAALVGALGLGKVDLYGDSYGSFFAQVFAARYPHLIRSVTLDSTYSSLGLDPWYRSTEGSMQVDFDTVCSRAAACAQAAPGSSWQRISALAQSLREKPVSGTVPGPTGAPQSVTMNVVGLVDLLNDAAGDAAIYRGLDAAARALLSGGDPAPLLRLYAQRLAEDEAYFGIAPQQYSAGLYLAVSCLDYPQLFSIGASPQTRLSELGAAEAGLPGSTFSPFTTAEWLAQDQNTEAYSACLRWPSPTIAQPPAVGPAPLLPASMPVLILGGELDTWTPPVDAPKVLALLGGHSRLIELANATHVVGEGDTLCGSSLIQRFVGTPKAIDTLDASCAPLVPAIHAVGVYASSLAAQPPIEPAPGSTAPAADLRLAAAAVSTAGDALARFRATEAVRDRGLHGGSVTAGRGGSLLTLSGDQLVPGVRVNGTVTLTPAAIAVNGDGAVASLTVSEPGMPRATFTATWTTAGSAPAEVAGTVGPQAVQGSMPAP